MEQEFDFNMIVKVLVVGAILISALLKRIAKPSPEQVEEMNDEGSEPDITKRLFEMMRQSMEPRAEQGQAEEGEIVARPQRQPSPRSSAPSPIKRSEGRAQESVKAKAPTPIESGEIGSAESSEIIEDFDLKKAVIYSEILTPKFEEK